MSDEAPVAQVDESNPEEEQLEIQGGLERQPNLQSVNWLLQINQFGQLDLNPPYQRRSVWSLREKQRFLDTVLKNYPSPALFLHTTFDAEGNTTYHVVDGKQRISAILDFVANRIRLAKDFGDARLDGQNWKGLAPYPAIRRRLWKYLLTVEQLDDVQDAVVREVFERLNRNSRKLEPQEMRHARFDGWLISYLETQAESEIWRQLKVSTAAKARRMADVQLVSEFAAVSLSGDVTGFDQEALDAMYALYEDPAETVPDFDPDVFTNAFERAALFLRDMEEHNKVVTSMATSRNHVYPLWAFVALSDVGTLDASAIAEKYLSFMTEFVRMRELDSADASRDRSGDDSRVLSYVQNSSGASTEEPQRRARYESLRDYLSE